MPNDEYNSEKLRAYANSLREAAVDLDEVASAISNDAGRNLILSKEEQRLIKALRNCPLMLDPLEGWSQTTFLYCGKYLRSYSGIGVVPLGDEPQEEELLSAFHEFVKAKNEKE